MTRGAFVQHRDAAHNTLQRQAQPRLHPFQGGTSTTLESGSDVEENLDEEMPPQGSYYTVHPVLDGKTVNSTLLLYDS